MRIDFKSTALSLALVLVATAASAQAEDQTVRERARAHFEEGVRFFAEDRYPAALAEFLLSHRARPRTSVLYNIAMCQKAVGDYPASIATFERFLAENGHKGDAAQRAEIEALVREMRSDLGRIRIAGAPEGTRVLVDGADVSLSGGRGGIDVAPGNRRVLIEYGDGETDERVVVVARNAEVAIDLAPLKPPAPAAAKKARPTPPNPFEEGSESEAATATKRRVDLFGSPEGRLVWIGGVPVRAIPGKKWLRPGKYKVEILERGNRRRDAGFIEVAAGKPSSFHLPPPWAPPDTEEEGPRPAKVAFFVFITTGSVVGFSSILVGRESSSRTRLSRNDPGNLVLESNAKGWATAANSLFAITGVMGFSALVSGIVWGVQVRKEREAAENGDGDESSADIAAWLLPTPGGASLTVGGAF